MFQLERTLGTKMERLSLAGAGDKPQSAERAEQVRERVSSLPPAQRAKMVMLPGEVLQTQLEG